MFTLMLTTELELNNLLRINFKLDIYESVQKGSSFTKGQRWAVY